MNSNSKRLRAISYDLAAQWLKTMLPVAEQEKVTIDSVKKFEAEQEQYIYTKFGERRCAPYSSRWFYLKLKKAYKKGIRPDFTLQSVLELG